MERAALFLLLSLAGMPGLWEVARFGHWQKPDLRELIRQNRAYQEHIEKTLNLYPNENSELLAEAETLRKVYDALEDALFSTSEQMQYMGVLRLKRIIGDEAFRAGQLPPHLPLWRFKPIR